jgi:hypothetical protein
MSLQYVLSLLSLLYLYRLSGNDFQSRCSFSFRVHVRIGQRLPHNSTRLCYATTSNNGGSSASHAPTKGDCLTTASDSHWAVCLEDSLQTLVFLSLNSPAQSQTQSSFTNGGLPPISAFWCQAPSESRPEIFFCGHSPYIRMAATSV